MWEYTVQPNSILRVNAQSLVDAGKAATVVLFAEVGRRRHQCELQQWHNGKLSGDIIIIVLRHQQAE